VQSAALRRQHREKRHENQLYQRLDTFGMSDLKGIRDLSNAAFAGEPLTPQPGLRTKDQVKAGFTF
jgi:hypothetical protein